jgi:hypothetical protein
LGGGNRLETQTATQIVGRLVDTGEELLENLDYERYDRWNVGALQVLDLIFGQPSEPFMSFKFPGGGEAANSREGRVKNSITQKLKVLSFVQKDLADGSLRPKLGWGNSSEEIEKSLSGIS